MRKIQITINGETFIAKLNNSAASQAFAYQLPLTLVMNELNGNEKYAELKINFATHAVFPRRIAEGDLMLFGSRCLVLFYKSFSTSYAYTVLGAVENPAGLAKALGEGEVNVTFRRLDEAGEEAK